MTTRESKRPAAESAESAADAAGAIVVGAGLAGLVAAAEIADSGERVLLLDQEGEQNLGGQAFWSFGGLFFVDSPEQRRLGIRDSLALATGDWLNTARFDRPEDHWPRQWAQAYLEFAAGEKRAWLHRLGMRWFAAVGWAERGGQGAGAPGNSVPRFHVTWGTGPGVLEPFVRRVRAHVQAGRIVLRFRHRVTQLIRQGGAVVGVAGERLVQDGAARGERSSRVVTGDFQLRAGAVLLTSGGIGGNLELVRKNWPRERLGDPPAFMVAGVPRHVDGLLRGVAQEAGGQVINADRMWHYTEGLRNWNPVWENHGIRVLPGPSSLWLSPGGERLPAPNYPGFDTLASLTHIGQRGYPYTWFLLNERIIRREFALSGSEQNPDLTHKDLRGVLRRVGGVQAPLRAFMERGEDFVVRGTLPELIGGMQALTGDGLLDPERVEREVRERDAQLANPFGKDAQLAAVRAARAYLGDRLTRVAKPQPLLKPENGPLIAVRMNILTRKSLGGLETDLQGRVLTAGGGALPGLYAAGEVAGFGGGGLHGYRSLEGTFLGGCLFSGRVAGRAVAGILKI